MSLAGLAFAALAAACVSSGAQAGRTAPGPNQYLITAEEFATANVSNLYDGILQLRPMWLGRRIPMADVRLGSQTNFTVYVDRVRVGGLDALRGISPASVVTVRFLAANQAMGDFRQDEMRGTIQVTTRVAR
jgi:hypothetical protein